MSHASERTFIRQQALSSRRPSRLKIYRSTGKLPVGELAPEIELPDSTQVPLRLSELISHNPIGADLLSRALVSLPPLDGGLPGSVSGNPDGWRERNMSRRQGLGHLQFGGKGGIAKPAVFIIDSSHVVRYAAVDSIAGRVPASEIVFLLRNGAGGDRFDWSLHSS